MAIKNKKNLSCLTNSLQAGVTLIEMVVVVGIIALVSSVIIFNYSDFSTNVSLRNLSQDIALSVRKAQTYATSVHTLEGLSGVSTRTYKGYGISFAVAPAYSTSNDEYLPNSKQFILFADTEPNGIYDPGDECESPIPTNECLETFNINTSDNIVEVCGVINGNEICAEEGVIDITYRRPSPDASICYREDPDSSACQNVSAAIIKIQSAKGLLRSVTVFNTGQISVQ